MSLVLLARGKAEGRNGGAERSENSMAGVIEFRPRAEAEKFIPNRAGMRVCPPTTGPKLPSKSELPRPLSPGVQQSLEWRIGLSEKFDENRIRPVG